ncbi:EpsG family protein, partial [Acinetobacter baumannii]|nr:EpsG family protein [Acinetobacter baumannii]
MDLNRNIFSYSIFFYYYFLIDKKNIIKLVFFSLLAVWVHSSALILVILYLLSNIKLGKFLNTFLLIFSLSVGYFLPEIISKATFFIEFIP